MTGLRCSVVLGLVAMMVGCDGPGRAEGAEEIEDSGLWDGDGDGYAAAEQGGLDCDDGDSAVSPEGVEVTYDGLDNDCDPATRDDDLDGDGYPSAEDCNDALVAVSPGAEDLVGDGYDQNCDGLDGADADGDGVASEGSLGTDCDDADDTVYPGALERCDDGVVNDCDAADDSAAYAECGWSGEMKLGDSAMRVTGASADELFGYTVSMAGDLDGDGKSDAAVGAIHHNTNVSYAGAVYVMGDDATEGPVGADVPVWFGESAGDRLGYGLASAGDLDGDGLDDLAMGAPTLSDESGTVGGVYLAFGPATAGGSVSEADLRLTGMRDGDKLGQYLNSASDLTGDGLQDLAIAAYGYEGYFGEDGAVYVISGDAKSGAVDDAATAMIVSPIGDGSFGTALTTGDLNGDGFPDLVIGASGSDVGAANAGQVFTLYGPLVGTINAVDADSTITSFQEDAYLGLAISAGGDTNGDGYADLLVGEPYAWSEDQGQGLLYEGPVSGELGPVDATFRVNGEVSSAHAGRAVELSGDYNGDGLADPVVGLSSTSLETGELTASAYVLISPLSGVLASSPDAELIPEPAGTNVGGQMSAGDIDGDGLSDLLMGASGYLDATTSAGAAYLLYGYSY